MAARAVAARESRARACIVERLVWTVRSLWTGLELGG